MTARRPSSRTVARVVNVGQDWFTFTLPAAEWDYVFTMGRLLVPREVDDALEEGVSEIPVSANFWVKYPSQVRFKHWGLG